MNLSRTHDMSIVHGILTHPKIWPHMHDDGVEQYDPLDAEHINWMLVDDGEPAGLFMVYALTTACFEMHTALLPRTWGAQAAEAAQLLLGWFFAETSCQKMVTNVPAYNRPALRFAKQGGMQIEGVNRKSYLKNGVLQDQIMLGITKEEFLCQSQQSQQSQR